MYLASQILGIVIIVENFFIFFQRRRETLLILKLISDVLTFVQLMLIGGITGAVLNAIAIFREIVCYNRNKTKWASSRFWLYFFILIMFLSPILTATYRVFSLMWFVCFIPATGSVLNVIGLYSTSPHVTRIFSLFNTILWIIYSIAILNWTQVVNALIILISIIIGLIDDHIQKNKAQSTGSICENI